MTSIESASGEPHEFFASADLLISLAKALHHVGFPSHVIEQNVGAAARALNMQLEMLSLPTGIFATFYQHGRPVTYAIRERPGAVNLEQMNLLMQSTCELISGALPREQAKARLQQIMAAPQRWGKLSRVVAYVLSASAFAVFFGGASKEVIVASFVGLAAGILAVFMRSKNSTQLFEFSAAVCAAAISGFGDRVFGEFVEWIPIAAGLIILLPGISLIDAVSELSRGHLDSGMSRLAGVGVVFLALTFGCVMGVALSYLVPHSEQKLLLHPYSQWWLAPALVVVAVGSTIRFRARPKDVPLIFLASAMALLTARFAAASLGYAAGPFLAAMLLGVAGSLVGRRGKVTPELVVIPGIALLVPGSIGVQCMASLLSRDTTLGVEAGFQMFLIAMALTSGLLFSQMLIRDRRTDRRVES